MKLLHLLKITAALMLIALCTEASASSTASVHWVGTWAAASDSAGPALQPQTIRQVIRTTVGGSHVRIRLSNLYGTAPLTIGSARIAARDHGTSIRADSDHALLFNGSPLVTIAPGENTLSDAVRMQTAPLQELAVSLYLPEGSGPSTLHGAAMQTTYLALGDDRSRAVLFPFEATDDSRYFLTDVEVAAAVDTTAIVIVGDSIVDGIGSTAERNTRWTDLLAQGLRDRLPAVSVINSGIAGNCILQDGADPFVGPSTLSRFDRDALSKPAVRWVVLAQGINDIVASDMLRDRSQQVSAEQIINGMRTLIQRAHDRNLKICGATLLPLGGVQPPFIYSAAGEAKRQAVHAWVRGAGAFDAVLDAEEIMRDPEQQDRLLPAFDSGDHLHPNDAGYQAMAEQAIALWVRLAE